MIKVKNGSSNLAPYIRSRTCAQGNLHVTRLYAKPDDQVIWILSDERSIRENNGEEVK